MNVTPMYGLTVSMTPYKFKDKEKCINNYVEYMLLRSMRMFEYTGLPDTMPMRAFETYLQMNGMVCVFKHNDELYCSFGGWGGEPDAYYVPTKFVVANPYLNVFETFTVGENCVIVRNDSLYKGMRPMFKRYATQLVSNDISMQVAGINSRIISLINAPDDRTRESAELFLKKIEDGELGVIAGNAFLDGIRTEQYASTNHAGLISALIELQQYYKASWYNELGLQSNYNMKREAINASESQMNEDALLPLIDDMIACRKDGLAEIREMFGVDIEVEFASSWQDNRIELAIEQDQLMQENEIVDDDGGEDESNYLDNDDSEAESIIEDAIEEVIDLVQEESNETQDSVPDDDNGERDSD